MEDRRNEGALGYIFTSWTGRSLLSFLLIGLALIGISRSREGNIEEFAENLQLSHRTIAQADIAEDNLRTLGRELAGGRASSASVGEAMEDIKNGLEGIKRLPGFRGTDEVDQLLSVLGTVESGLAAGLFAAAVEGPGGEGARIIEALDYQWKELRRALREEEDRITQRALRRARQSASRSIPWVVALGMLGCLLFLGSVSLIWQGREKLRSQIAELRRGNFGKVTPIENLDEHHRLIDELNRLSEDLARREEESARFRREEEKLLRQLRHALDAAAEGNFARDFSHRGREEWTAVTESLSKLLVVFQRLQQSEEKLRKERKHSLAVPEEELRRLRALLDDDLENLAQTLDLFSGDSPLRGVALEMATVLGGQREALANVRSRLDRILENSESVVKSVAEQESGLEQEYRYIHETSSTVDQVSVAAKQSAQMVEHVFKSAQKAMEYAEGGQNLVQQSIEGMSRIAEQVDTIAHHILGLASRSQEVGNIVRDIGEVSKQTKLLALNAAIEAAGAGEHGKGFAVVAKEIRELAVKSSRSTEDIQKLIRQMQDATNTAVLSTEEGSKSVKAGVTAIDSLNTSFGQILERFQEVVESAQQISTAAQEQTTGARQVASSIGNIDRMMLGSLKSLQQLKEHLEGSRDLARSFKDSVRTETGGKRREG